MRLKDKWYDLAIEEIDKVPDFEIDSRIKELIKLVAMQAAEEDYNHLIETGEQSHQHRKEGDK